MTHVQLAAATAAAAISLTAAMAGSARGAADPGLFRFHDCHGPAGTPAAFNATKENLPDAAAHPASAGIAYLLADRSAVFVVKEFGDAPIAPGIPARDLTVTCLVDIPLGTFTFTGALDPE